MGSLFSPVVPQYTTLSYTPQTTTTATSSANTSATETADTSTGSDDEESVRDLIRQANRGRSSLIQTSYRGVLSDTSDLSPQRKSLLGE